jgi:CelD/BcsL family acetyltransferase involved in cellulose biosynthesis
MACGALEQQIEFRREPLPPLAELEGQWRALEALAQPSFFTSWLWIGSWLAALPPWRQPALLRGVAGGATVALALVGASATRRRLGLVRARGLHLNETGDACFDAATIEHNGPLAERGHEGAALDALVGWFAGMDDSADELHIGGSLRRPSEAAVEARGLGRSERALPSYSLDLTRLADSGGELDPVLSTNARQQLRRALRHFERRGPLRLQPAETVPEALDFFLRLKALHVASWDRRGKPHAFAGSFFEPFHRLLIERGLPAGGVELFEATAGDTAIGYLYNFRRADRVYAYQSGLDYGDGGARPGVVAHALAIRQACRTGARIYDFLAGHNRLKESFSTHREPMLWQVVRQRRLRFHLEDLGRRLKRLGRRD